MAVTLNFLNEAPDLTGARQIFIGGPAGRLQEVGETSWLPAGLAPVWGKLVASLQPGDAYASTQSWVDADAGAIPALVFAISDRASRHNIKARPDILTQVLRGQHTEGRAVLFLLLDRPEDALPLGLAIGRAFPYFDARSTAGAEGTLDIVFLTQSGGVEAATLAEIALITEQVRQAARLVDLPPDRLNTDAFVDEAKRLAKALKADIQVLRTRELVKKGMGGLAGVGQAARQEPALVHLSYGGKTKAPKGKVALVGKGIVYDTGGLSIKPKAGMPGMKNDMAGAAAVLRTFVALVELGVDLEVHAILCLAENAIGPDAIRNDDILSLYSGKTVEINNTDAEGRLVLADGVAYATKDLEADWIIDIATLTGAQLMSTGKLHAAIVSNDEDLEAVALEAAFASGDLVFPQPYAPEFYRAEFKSAVADMRNSVRDRMNAQTSCAAQFIAEHLGTGERPWLHIDMAGPSTRWDRGTGYGVGLLTSVVRSLDVDA